MNSTLLAIFAAVMLGSAMAATTLQFPAEDAKAHFEIPVIEVTPDIVIKPNLPISRQTRATRSWAECALLCDESSLNTVCAFNGTCVFEFANRCILDKFNCVHPDFGYKAIKQDVCPVRWLGCTRA